MFALYIGVRGVGLVQILANTLEDVNAYAEGIQEARSARIPFRWNYDGGPECFIDGHEIVSFSYGVYKDYQAEHLAIAKRTSKRFDAGEGWKAEDEPDVS